MKQTWQTLNLPKVKPMFPRPIMSNMQMHEMLPTGSSSGAIRVAMDLGKCRRAWANGVDIVNSAKKYTTLFDQYMRWIERCGDSGSTVFVWKDCEDNIVASADNHFEHAMNHFTMGLIDMYTSNIDTANVHFATCIEAAKHVPAIPGAQFMRYNCRYFETTADILRRGARIQELTVLTEPSARAALANELLCGFPDVALKSNIWEYAQSVKHTLFEHTMLANMQVHAEADEFAQAHLYASILDDKPNMRFFESMALTARQKLIDVDEWIETMRPTPIIHAVPPEAEYMGFDSVAPTGVDVPNLQSSSSQ